MSAAVLALGYRTKTEAVLALREQGLSTSAIAARVGIETKSVSALEASARRGTGGRRRQQPDALAEALADQRVVPIDAEVLQALRPYAARRGISVVVLTRRLLVTLADEGLVDALLDDEEDRRR